MLRGRYGLTCRQHNSIEDELIIECAEGRKKKNAFCNPWKYITDEKDSSEC